MIIIKLKGGLGNQMFQYAAAKALAIHNKTQTKLDISEYSTDQLRNFDLTKLNADIAVATESEIKRLKAYNSLDRVISRMTPINKRRFYKEPFFHFDNNFFKLGPDIYIQGYFQSEKYFSPIQEIIRKEYTLKETIQCKVEKLSHELKYVNSVSIHIRKGDYQNKETQDVHGILPIEYYHKAIRKIRQLVADPKFYIFTDDKRWAEDNFNVPNSTIVSGNFSTDHFEDLYLMTQCSHNIIANSSFSWWGAWLNANPNKNVIAPLKWFNNGPSDVQDLIPETWQRF